MIEVILCIVAFAFILLGVARLLDDKHNLLKLLLICVVVISSLLVGAIAQDNDEYCELVVSNYTVNGNTTSNTYDYSCHDTGNTTGLTFYRLIIGFFVVFFLYVVYYYAYEVFNAFKKWYNNR